VGTWDHLYADIAGCVPSRSAHRRHHWASILFTKLFEQVLIDVAEPEQRRCRRPQTPNDIATPRLLRLSFVQLLREAA
jgi:hypothetical protein